MKNINVVDRKVRNWHNAPKFNYTLVEEVQDTTDPEIFGGKQESFLLNGKSTCKVKLSSDDIDTIKKTINLLKKHIYQLTGNYYNYRISKETKNVWADFTKDITQLANIAVSEDLLIKYHKINQVFKTNDILTEYDLISELLKYVYSDLNRHEAEFLGVTLIMKVYIAQKMLKVLNKYGRLEITFETKCY